MEILNYLALRSDGLFDCEFDDCPQGEDAHLSHIIVRMQRNSKGELEFKVLKDRDHGLIKSEG